MAADTNGCGRPRLPRIPRLARSAPDAMGQNRTARMSTVATVSGPNARSSTLSRPVARDKTPALRPAFQSLTTNRVWLSSWPTNASDLPSGLKRMADTPRRRPLILSTHTSILPSARLASQICGAW